MNRSWRPLVILLLAATALWFAFGPLRDARSGTAQERPPSNTSTTTPKARTPSHPSGTRTSGGGIFDVLDEAAKRREQARTGTTGSAGVRQARHTNSRTTAKRPAANRLTARTDRDFTSSLQSALDGFGARLAKH